jgi:hypothetical protein
MRVENAVEELVRIHEAMLNFRAELAAWQSRDFPLLGFDVVRTWHCLRAQPGMDVKFAGDLNDQGYETFLPRTFEKKTLKDESIAPVARLRFSPYLFVCIDYSRQRFHPITETIGYDDVLRLQFDDVGGVRSAQPSVVPLDVILGMRQDEHADYEASIRRVRQEESLYREGDKVRVLKPGPVFERETSIQDARPGSVVVAFGQFPLRLNEGDVVPLDPKLLVRRAADRAAAEQAALVATGKKATAAA